MSFALSSFRKDLARWRQDFMATLIWVAIPLMLGGLITILMGSEVRPHGVLLLVDEDETVLSELVVGAYSSGELGEFISVEKTDFDDGLERVNEGEASGLLVIPQASSGTLPRSCSMRAFTRTNCSATRFRRLRR